MNAGKSTEDDATTASDPGIISGGRQSVHGHITIDREVTSQPTCFAHPNRGSAPASGLATVPCHGISRPASAWMLLAGISVLAGWLGWNYGRQNTIRVRVTGPSMAPTLLGEHYLADCTRCDHRGIAIDASSDEPLPTTVPCTLCGGTLSVDLETVHAGDVVEVQPGMNRREIKAGQLIAIRSEADSPIRVKRLVAMPGQIVDQVDGRLTVDGERIEDRLACDSLSQHPRLLVADSNRRAASSQNPIWTPLADSREGWRRSDDGNWSTTTSAPAQWMVYQHVNVYENNHPSAVLDEYPYNASLRRRLQNADRLGVTAELETTGPVRVEIAYWLPDQIVVDTQTYDRSQTIGSCTATAISPRGDIKATNQLSETKRLSEAKQLSDSTQMLNELQTIVSPTAPVAIRIRPAAEHSKPKESVSLSEIKIWKSINYRLRRTDKRSPYPLMLADDQYFVLGDNVPVSIDSRDHGPVDRDQIIGLIKLRE
tara:strand:- start:9916 stop:11367 length:1452 start_codon:yes stop_codon:yes gene_type:complete